MGCPCKLDRCQTRLAKIINTVVPRYRECQVLVAGDSKLSGIVTKRVVVERSAGGGTPWSI